jgi:hypothetical protein
MRLLAQQQGWLPTNPHHHHQDGEEKQAWVFEEKEEEVLEGQAEGLEKERFVQWERTEQLIKLCSQPIQVEEEAEEVLEGEPRAGAAVEAEQQPEQGRVLSIEFCAKGVGDSA